MIDIIGFFLLFLVWDQDQDQGIVGGGPTASHFSLLVQRKVTKRNPQTAPFEAIRPHCVGVGS